MGRVTTRRRITVIDVTAAQSRERSDTLSVEEPLELRLGGEPLTVTMRTPGHDIELIHGFLHSEGVIRSAEDVSMARYCEGAVTSSETGFDENTYNVINVDLAPGVAPPAASATRNFLTSSSCGVCGKASIEQLRTQTTYDVRADPVRIAASTMVGFPAALRTRQRKVIGWALLERRLPLTGCVLMVSSRASFELAQKAVMAGIPCLAAVSAPSSLAVDSAEDAGMTLVGFLRGDRLNAYAGPERITLD